MVKSPDDSVIAKNNPTYCRICILMQSPAFISGSFAYYIGRAVIDIWGPFPVCILYSWGICEDMSLTTGFESCGQGAEARDEQLVQAP